MKQKNSGEPTVAVLGLGLIGSIWARHLDDAGLLAATWNRSHKPDAPRRVASPLAAAESADVLLIVVADPPAVASVLHEIAPALTANRLVIQSSTIGSADSTAFRQKVEAAGGRYLEAPFTGSKPAAQEKKTIFYLGGDTKTVEAAESTLSRISARRIHVGTGEQACAVKLAMNLQIAAQAQALCEALHTVRQAGVSDDTFFTCMKGNASWSGLSALKEPKLRTGDFDPQFSVKHLLKDLRLLEQAAGDLPALSMMIHRLKRLSERGLSNQDFIALYRLLDGPASGPGKFT
ncbi:MAG TPA: NAD(P)-dependent oxidoreductase [Kiritimatiellia bacterium]|nr:NAD(P)-dependent oxidoreductase [Kiritimatiellia bacterium]HMP00125.1 NAD(P)-dependent oxidoreductase [Kiritimatiellia bacterium]HMP96586.1 NAD(P)-dependent oxidoreductase [Kiritimatiellia bacterium]